MNAAGWRSPKFARRLFVCLLAATQLFRGLTLLGQEADCKDILRTEVAGLSEGRIEKIAAVREFVWRHWSDHKCGELFLTTWSREGVRTDSHYKIEVIRSNAMMLTGTFSRREDPDAPVDALAIPASGHPVQKTAVETSSYQAYGIERVKLEVPFILEKAKRIPDEKVVPPSKYHLRFRDKDGKVIAEF
jgi:hypothetical protein